MMDDASTRSTRNLSVGIATTKALSFPSRAFTFSPLVKSLITSACPSANPFFFSRMDFPASTFSTERTASHSPFVTSGFPK
jgi:hypothetical protein